MSNDVVSIKRGRPRKFTIDQVGRVLTRCHGLRAMTAEKLGCEPRTVSTYIKRSKTLQALEKEIIEASLDKAENTLLNAIDNGGVTAAMFYLKTKGKSRGYTEKMELSGPGGGPISIEATRAQFHDRLDAMRENALDASAVEVEFDSDSS